MHRCTVCHRPMQFEYVELPRIGLDNKPTQYRNVRRYHCPEGCRGIRLDFSKAKPATSGVRPKVVPLIKPLEKTPDFNDRVLAIGMLIGYAILVSSLLYIPTSWALKLGAIAFLTVGLLGTYRFATQRVVLPSYFPVPRPTQTEAPAEPARTTVQTTQQAQPAAAVATAPATASTATATAEAPAEASAPVGGGIPMKVMLEGEEFNLDVSPGENMLDAALDRDVGIDFSCLEGLCDSCEVKVLVGVENISPPTQEEFDMLGEDDVKSGKRLACQVVVNGPVSIEQ